MSETKTRIGQRTLPTTMVVNGHDVPCILDTGAQTVCVPDSIMREIGATQIGTVNVGGAVSHQTVPAYQAMVGIKGLPDFSHEVEVLGLSTNIALLGFNLFRYLAEIAINFSADEVTFTADDLNSVVHKMQSHEMLS